MKTVPAAKLVEHYVAVAGAVVGRDLIALCCHFKPAFEEGQPVSQIFWHEEGSWFVGPMFEFEAVSVCSTGNGRAVAVLGREGHLAMVDQDQIQTLPAASVPGCAGPFRRLKRIGDKFAALGDVRSLVQCVNGSPRLITDGGVSNLNFQSEEDLIEQIIRDTEVGFDFDGESLEKLVLVGSSGCALSIQGRSAVSLDAPTNMPIYSITWCGEGRFVCGGRAGLILSYRSGAWESHEVAENCGDISSLTYSAGSFFACDGRQVFQSQDLPNWAPVSFGSSAIVPAHELCSSSDGLLTVAGKEAWISQDGKQWRPLLG